MGSGMPNALPLAPTVVDSSVSIARRADHSATHRAGRNPIVAARRAGEQRLQGLLDGRVRRAVVDLDGDHERLRGVLIEEVVEAPEDVLEGRGLVEQEVGCHTC